MTEEIAADHFADYLGLVAIDFAERSLRPVMDEALPILRQSVRDNFTSSASPDNVDWLPRRVEGDGHPLLIDTGKLMQAAVGSGSGAITEQGDRMVLIGVSGDVVKYAAIHNFGGVTRPMPQREFMGAKAEHLDECSQMISDYVLWNFF